MNKTTDLVAQAIRAHFGARCVTQEPGCLTCEAWSSYDELQRRPGQIRRSVLKAAIRVILAESRKLSGLPLGSRQSQIGRDGAVSLLQNLAFDVASLENKDTGFSGERMG